MLKFVVGAVRVRLIIAAGSGCVLRRRILPRFRKTSCHVSAVINIFPRQKNRTRSARIHLHKTKKIPRFQSGDFVFLIFCRAYGIVLLLSIAYALPGWLFAWCFKSVPMWLICASDESSLCPLCTTAIATESNPNS